MLIIVTSSEDMLALQQTESGSEAHQRMMAEKISVGELATTQLIALPPVPSCAELIATLKRSKHQAFPITAEVSQAYQSGGF